MGSRPCRVRSAWIIGAREVKTMGFPRETRRNCARGVNGRRDKKRNLPPWQGRFLFVSGPSWSRGPKRKRFLKRLARLLGLPPAQRATCRRERTVLTSWTWSCSSWSSTSWRRPSSSRRTFQLPSLPWRLPPFLCDKFTEREIYRQRFFSVVQTIFAPLRARGEIRGARRAGSIAENAAPAARSRVADC